MRSANPVVSSGSPGDNATAHSGAVRVSNVPEARFEGRDVFMMAIQMPNLTSYSGSWLMWYADRTQRIAGLAPIAPPVPHRKVDPKYIASAVAERVEGKVRLGCVITKQGTVSGVELLRGIDDRLNKSAEEALAKWEFYPATRNGEPVEVDVVVEIPFRLEPLAPKP
jgi:TonB family protein